MGNVAADIQSFLQAKAFACAGASNNRAKFGNKVLRCYLQHHKKVYPINPHEKIIEGLQAFTEISLLPDDATSLSIITPPPISEKIMKQAIEKGMTHIWLQPGAESEPGIQLCRKMGITVIAHGPCLLVELGFNEE